MDADRDALPTEVGQGPVAQDPVHKLEAAVPATARVEDLLQTNGANAGPQLGLARLVAEDRSTRRDEPAELHVQDDSHASIPRSVRI